MMMATYGKMEINEKIQLAIQRRGIKPAELARQVGVDSARVHRWLKAELKPTVYMLLNISRATGIPMEFFVDPEISSIPEPGNPSEIEKKILMAAEVVGYEIALKRIFNLPESKALPGKSYGELEEEGRDED